MFVLMHVLIFHKLVGVVVIVVDGPCLIFYYYYYCLFWQYWSPHEMSRRSRRRRWKWRKRRDGFLLHP